MKKNKRLISLFAALLGLAILSRWIPHPPQFTALTAAAIFGGLFFSRPLLVVALPLLAIFISDALFAGFYPGAVINYAALILAALTTYFFAQSSKNSSVSGAQKVLGAVSGSLVFFALSNLAVFITSGMYAHSLAGLINCYTMALPFYGFQVLGEVVYGSAMAATYFILNGRSWVWNSSLEGSSL
jgi:hypothetical protein